MDLSNKQAAQSLNVPEAQSPNMSEAQGSGSKDAKQRGAVLLEFAFILIILVPLLTFVFDYGAAWGSARENAAAARSGAAVGAQQLQERDSDFHIVAAVMNSLPDHEVLQISVYLVDSAEGGPPAGCRLGEGGGGGSAGVLGRCNVYTASSISSVLIAGAPSASTPCSSFSVGGKWCPTDRTKANVDGKYIGVAVWSRTSPLIGLVPSSALTEGKFQHYDFAVYPMIHIG